LSPGGRSTVHIYTQTIHRTVQNKQYIEQHNNFGRVRAVPRGILKYEDKRMCVHTYVRLYVMCAYVRMYVCNYRKKEGQMNRHKKYTAVVLYKTKNCIKYVISST